MVSRNTFNRVRDFARLFADFYPISQCASYVWNGFLSRNQGAEAGPIGYRLRSLGGRRVFVRPGTSDFVVLYETFGATYDVAPRGLTAETGLRIWDLGTNIGMTVAKYAAAFPEARITGVELDAENAKLARQNLAQFGPRCDVITGAVWIEDTEVSYCISPGCEHGAAVESGIQNTDERLAPAFSLDTLMRNDPEVHYVKMDIEGAEARILKENTSWSRKVLTIKVECHQPYSVEEAECDLQSLGFSVDRSNSHWASVVGYRVAA